MLPAPKRYLAFFLLYQVLTADPSHAQSNLGALDKQCMDAKTPAQCRLAVPACIQFSEQKNTERPSTLNDTRMVKILNQLGECQYTLGNFAASEQAFRDAVIALRQLYGSEHIEIADTLDSLGTVMAAQGQFSPANILFTQSLAMRKKLLGPDDPSFALSLNNLAFTLENQGQLFQAELMYRQALEIRMKRLGPVHSDIVVSLSNLSVVLEKQGKYTQAERLIRQALDMKKKLLNPEDSDVTLLLNNLASVLESQGQYGRAETIYQQILEIRRKALGPEHPDIALSINNLAFVLQRQGQFARAETLTRQALDMAVKLLGPVHPLVAIAINNLASDLKSQGKYSQAEPLYQQALEMRKKLLGVAHPDVATSLNNLAVVLTALGHYQQAERLCRQALEIRHKLLGAEHPDMAESFSMLALLLEHQGQHAQAEPLYRQAIALGKKLLGPIHPFVALSLSSLGKNLMVLGRVNDAKKQFLASARIRDEQLRATTSEIRVQSLLQILRDEEDIVYSLAVQAPTTAKTQQFALTMALLRKGRALEAGAISNRLIHRNILSPRLQQQYDNWLALREQREALLYGGFGKFKPQEYQAQLKDLQLQAESLEAQLAQLIPEIRSLQPPGFDSILPAVAKRVPSKGILIEVVWSRSYKAPAMPGASFWGEPHYIAIMLSADRRVVSVDLGPASVMDNLCRNLLAALRDPNTDPKPSAIALYQQLFAPLLPSLAGKKDVYLSLDGALNLIPFDALHDGTDYLLGRHHFHYLTSGRDLLRQPSHRTPGPPLILASPDFGLPDASQQDQPLSIYQQIGHLSPLPEAQSEAMLIAALIGVPPLLGARAREEAVRDARAPWLLHFATHALFLRDTDLPVLSDTRSSLILAASRMKPLSQVEPALEIATLPGDVGAMNRSALVLANVLQGHQADSTEHDGLLTAQEVRSFDLDGTQLVVLSACETGQGALSAGQGVYGLRRAFLVAGAETLVSSLWRVHDEATGALMTIYYRKLLNRRRPGARLEAMVEAMQELRKRPGRSHPYYWAPFLVIGQDGPLKPLDAKASARKLTEAR